MNYATGRHKKMYTEKIYKRERMREREREREREGERKKKKMQWINVVIDRLNLALIPIGRRMVSTSVWPRLNLMAQSSSKLLNDVVAWCQEERNVHYVDETFKSRVLSRPAIGMSRECYPFISFASTKLDIAESFSLFLFIVCVCVCLCVRVMIPTISMSSCILAHVAFKFDGHIGRGRSGCHNRGGGRGC